MIKTVNRHKTVHAHADGFNVYYMDNNKFYSFLYPSKTSVTQIYGSSYRGVRYQDRANQSRYEPPYSNRQEQLYSQAMKGLAAYSPHDLRNMKLSEKQSIYQLHRQTQQVITDWVKALNHDIDLLLTRLIPRSPVTLALIDSTHNIAPAEMSHLFPLSHFGISRRQIISRLITTGVLPDNYCTL